jgi:membrane associated rhomboid family serine protease
MRVSHSAIGRLIRVTDAAPPTYAAPPPKGPHPVALAIAYDLVTRYRLRLADARDGRLGELLNQYMLAAAMWNGPRAALVAFYDPPADPAQAGPDLAARCEAARRWGLERMGLQGAQVCDILLIALRPLVGTLSVATRPGDPVRLGVAWIDPVAGNAGAVLPIPPGMPSVSELRARTRSVLEGAPVPTLAAVDLAERQAVAGGYVAPVRRAMVTQPYMTYGLIAVFVLIWILEFVTISANPASTGPDICAWGALPNQTLGPLPGCAGGATITWWRFVSSAFLHDPTNVYHVLFNGIAMLFIGRLVEQLYGRLVLIGAFLITAIAGGLLWVAVSTVGPGLPGITPGTISLGASGGIAGLIGLLLMVGRVQGKNVPVGIAHTVRNYAVTVIVLNVVLTFVFGPSLDINNYAHIGGLIAGALLGCVLPPLRSIGGRDVNIYEKVLLWAAVAFSAVALLVAILNLASAVVHPPTPFAG